METRGRAVLAAALPHSETILHHGQQKSKQEIHICRSKFQSKHFGKHNGKQKRGTEFLIGILPKFCRKKLSIIRRRETARKLGGRYFTKISTAKKSRKKSTKILFLQLYTAFSNAKSPKMDNTGERLLSFPYWFCWTVCRSKIFGKP